MSHPNQWHMEWYLAMKITRGGGGAGFFRGDSYLLFATRYTTLYYSHGEHVLAFFLWLFFL